MKVVEEKIVEVTREAAREAGLLRSGEYRHESDWYKTRRPGKLADDKAKAAGIEEEAKGRVEALTAGAASLEKGIGLVGELMKVDDEAVEKAGGEVPLIGALKKALGKQGVSMQAYWNGQVSQSCMHIQTLLKYPNLALFYF